MGKATEEQVYASCAENTSSGKDKKITYYQKTVEDNRVVITFWYKVYEDKTVVCETNSLPEAIKVYNEL